MISLYMCQHTFHHSCISEWYQRNATCPLCRTPIECELSIRAHFIGSEHPRATATVTHELLVRAYQKLMASEHREHGPIRRNSIGKMVAAVKSYCFKNSTTTPATQPAPSYLGPVQIVVRFGCISVQALEGNWTITEPLKAFGGSYVNHQDLCLGLRTSQLAGVSFFLFRLGTAAEAAAFYSALNAVRQQSVPGLGQERVYR
eukprot:m.28895 g.28895  ORF g.28895 m.28895 type:complete len:202 (+) comp4607_c0_seq1:259-864(+)